MVKNTQGGKKAKKRKNASEETDPVKTIIKGIASLCKESGIKTVAEFIETQEQADLLNELGVDYGQGWFFSRPMPIEDLN